MCVFVYCKIYANEEIKTPVLLSCRFHISCICDRLVFLIVTFGSILYSSTSSLKQTCSVMLQLNTRRSLSNTTRMKSLTFKSTDVNNYCSFWCLLSVLQFKICAKLNLLFSVLYKCLWSNMLLTYHLKSSIEPGEPDKCQIVGQLTKFLAGLVTGLPEKTGSPLTPNLSPDIAVRIKYKYKK